MILLINLLINLLSSRMPTATSNYSIDGLFTIDYLII